jgi:hypothetical protein
VLAALVPGLTMATWERAGRRRQVSFAWWLTAGLVGVWFGWYWIGPLVRGLFFDPRRLISLAAFYSVTLFVFTVGWCLLTIARRRPLE